MGIYLTNEVVFHGRSSYRKQAQLLSVCQDQVHTGRAEVLVFGSVLSREEQPVLDRCTTLPFLIRLRGVTVENRLKRYLREEGEIRACGKEGGKKGRSQTELKCHHIRLIRVFKCPGNRRWSMCLCRATLVKLLLSGSKMRITVGTMPRNVSEHNDEVRAVEILLCWENVCWGGVGSRRNTEIRPAILGPPLVLGLHWSRTWFHFLGCFTNNFRSVESICWAGSHFSSFGRANSTGKISLLSVY